MQEKHVNSKGDKTTKTYKDIWTTPKTQNDWYELMQTSVTKHAARGKQDKFSQRDVPMNNIFGKKR